MFHYEIITLIVDGHGLSIGLKKTRPDQPEFGNRRPYGHFFGGGRGGRRVLSRICYGFLSAHYREYFFVYRPAKLNVRFVVITEKNRPLAGAVRHVSGAIDAMLSTEDYRRRPIASHAEDDGFRTVFWVFPTTARVVPVSLETATKQSACIRGDVNGLHGRQT